MSDIVVYAAGPERLLEASMLLQRHGIACRVSQGPSIALPWVFAAPQQQQLLVPKQLAVRARAVLAPMLATQHAQAERARRGVRVWLIALALGSLGFIGFLIGMVDGPPWTRWCGMVFAIAASIVVVRLLGGRTRRRDAGA